MGLPPSPFLHLGECLGLRPLTPLLLTGQGPGPLYLHVRGAGSPLECTRLGGWSLGPKFWGGSPATPGAGTISSFSESTLMIPFSLKLQGMEGGPPPTKTSPLSSPYLF